MLLPLVWGVFIGQLQLWSTTDVAHMDETTALQAFIDGIFQALELIPADAHAVTFTPDEVLLQQCLQLISLHDALLEYH